MAVVRRLLLAAGLAAGLVAPALAQAPQIAVAASVKTAMDELVVAFRQATGQEVSVVYGASGNFTRQIRQGAPFQLFLSADEGFIFQLADAGLAADRGEVYAEGRVALFVPNGSPLKADGALADLRAGLRDGRVTRFAIASPEHAPYGRAAEQVLKGQGLWEPLQGRLAIGEDIAQTLRFATTGAAQGGLVAYSLVLAPQVRALGSFALVPADWHLPLRQRMALMKTAGPVARDFHAYLRTPAARQIFRRHGFLIAGEES
ncbi:molybdate ABC transporter substrate-binding protein [Phreatobacter sp.]|uniref:molybdate ABC transporter substrate-binding protein n=1 Tax=Phreatobacter sp. TaxID=1966341 RepID=UPI0025F87C23|nr:molybdate ABC transporter substrate-binding protein [Phreatobacter sp.]